MDELNQFPIPNPELKNTRWQIFLGTSIVFFIFGVGIALNSNIFSPQQAIEVNSKDINQKYYDTMRFVPDTEPEWEPREYTKTEPEPEINGEAAILVEIKTGKTHYTKNENEPRPIASLVKIMTAVIAIEHMDPSTQIRIDRDAAAVGENTMALDAGEIYTLEELLYGLILHSGNDAAYAIANNVAGSPTEFVNWMNLKAAELGLTNTYFSDPSGLDDRSHSTPLDLVKLTKYALKHDLFKEIVSTVETELFSEEGNHKYVYLYNQTNLLTTYPGVLGVKTGYTEDAGLCLITYAVNDGVEMVGVVLNSIDRKGDMILMLDDGFDEANVVVEHSLL